MKFKRNMVVEIIKGGPGQEGELMMKGIASDSSKDTDGHNLDPTGFDVSYFLQKGFMNWNHEWKKNPLSIVGRPTKASVNKNNELEIEYKLFKGHKTAEEVYQLAQVLELNGMNLGLSIEGSVIETDPKNPNKIVKAKITDCAITPHPKNSGTITSIIKANHFDELVDFSKMGAFTVSPEGELIVKGTDTDTVGDIMPESVEGMSKKKKKKKGNEDDEDEDEDEKLTKSEVIERISKLNKGITLATANAIFDYTIEFQKSEEMNKKENVSEVSDEALEGALTKLGLTKSEEIVEVVKPDTAPESELKKALVDMTKEERDAYKAELVKSLGDIDKLDKPATAPVIEVVGESELVKAVTAAILGSEERMTASYLEKSQALGTLTSETIDLVKAFKNEFEERLEKLEDQPVGGRAVLTKGYVPKPGTELEKGEQTDGEVYSMSQNKAQLCTRLTDLAIEKAEGVDKIDGRLRADLIGLEAGSHLAESVVQFAKANNIQIIQ